MNSCPLCLVQKTLIYFQDEKATYHQCDCCSLVFLDPRNRISREDELARYEEHNNSPDDPNYREFLSALYRPMKERVSANSKGLDFGSGPGPTLSVMFSEAGHSMKVYDPFFSPTRDPLGERYDFVTCTETAEHFFEPNREFELLDSLLQPKGWLGLMTQPVVSKEAFNDWYYRRDPTHVCFYSKESFEWIAQEKKWTFEFIKPGVYFFQKK